MEKNSFRNGSGGVFRMAFSCWLFSQKSSNSITDVSKGYMPSTKSASSL